MTDKLVGAPGVPLWDETMAPMLTVFWLLAMRLSHALLADTAPVTVPPEKLVTCSQENISSKLTAILVTSALRHCLLLAAHDVVNAAMVV